MTSQLKATKEGAILDQDCHHPFDVNLAASKLGLKFFKTAIRELKLEPSFESNL